jgi:hypothetical protein
MDFMPSFLPSFGPPNHAKTHIPTNTIKYVFYLISYLLVYSIRNSTQTFFFWISEIGNYFNARYTIFWQTFSKWQFIFQNGEKKGLKIYLPNFKK